MNFQTAVISTELHFLEDAESPESTVDCTGCKAPCCRSGHLNAIPLSFQEAQCLPHTFGNCQLNGKTFEKVALLSRHPLTGECVFVTPGGKCSIWEIRPKPCRVYSCLSDQNKQMKEFVSQRWPSE